MHYTVLGSGAMGLRFGILLQQSGQIVDFVDTWDKQVSTIIQQRGVYVSRDGKDRHLVPININFPEDYHGNPDAFIIFTKQMGLREMLKRSAHLFNEQQYVITLMNGMGHIEKINKYFKPNKVIAGTAMIGTVLNDAGDVDFIGKKGTGTINLVNETEKPDSFTNQVIKEFKKAQLGPTLTNNFLGTLLTKVIYNSVVNTLCSMYKLKEGEFISASVANKLIDELINEAYYVCDLANIKPLNTKEEEFDVIIHATRDVTPLHYPSMYQDISKNRPTEVDYINGYLYDLGLKYSYNAQLHNFLRDLVHLAEHAEAISN